MHEANLSDENIARRRAAGGGTFTIKMVIEARHSRRLLILQVRRTQLSQEYG
jgi:hypothetical protein